MNKNVTQIVFITDENYAMPTGVALYSLIKNKKPESIYHVSILCNQVSDNMKQRLLSCATETASVQIIDVAHSAVLEAMSQKTEHVSKTALFKFMLPDLFNSMDKILYLDGDIIVRGDLSDLYHTDINGYYVGAVKDMGPMVENKPPQNVKLNLAHINYFNSGVMLLNLSFMRAHNICEKLIAYRKNGKNFLMDQDALNVVMGVRTRWLSLRFNDINSKYQRYTRDKIANFYEIKNRNIKKYEVDGVLINHFASKLKPWKYDMPHYSKLFEQYHLSSPFADIAYSLQPYPPEPEPSSPEWIRTIGRLLRSNSLTKPVYSFLDLSRRNGILYAMKQIKPFLKRHKDDGIYRIVCFPYHIRRWFREKNILQTKCMNALNIAQPREHKIILSLTSFPARIHEVPTTILALLQQTMKPDRIILWLTNEEFPGGEAGLPRRLLRLKKYGLEIMFGENLRAHTKYFNTMKLFPDDLVITVDDDIHYPLDLVEVLYQSYLRHPNAVSAMRAHLITYDEDGELLPYDSWKYQYRDIVDVPMMGLFATGVGGVLYPPHCMHKELYNLDKLKSLAFMNDDIWLKFMQVMNRTPVVLATDSTKLEFVGNTQDVGLCYTNVRDGGNDEILENMMSAYNEFFGKGDTLLSRMKSIVYPFYVCSCCGRKLKKEDFKGYGNPIRPMAMCPHCRSLERHRMYVHYLRKHTNILKASKKKILHFAPEQGISELLSDPELKHDYYPVDYDPQFKGYIREIVDITEIPYKNEYFDFVILNHVLEHIKEEQQALSEVRRVLKKGATAMINVPVYPIDTTLEDPSYNTDELRTKYYGQRDHVRKYGQDFIKRLRKAGFRVTRVEYAKTFTKEEQHFLQFPHADDVAADIYICRK